MILYTPPHAPKTMPVVDLEGSNVPWEIHKACRETGFFYVSNHGVPQALIDAQLEWTSRFFDLPLGEKLAIHMEKSPATAGYEPIGHQVLDSQDPQSEKAPPDIKEAFQCAMELPDGHPLARARRRGFGHNLWPAALPSLPTTTRTHRSRSGSSWRASHASSPRTTCCPTSGQDPL